MSEHRLETPRGTLHYSLTRKQVKNLNLRVKAQGTVSVSASPRVSLASIEDFLLRKADFIFDALEQFQAKAPLAQQEPAGATGDRLLYLGEELVVAVVQGSRKIPWQREGTLFVVTEDVEDAGAIQALVEAFFQQQQRELFSALMAKYQSLFAGMDVPEAQLKIRSMRSRWGTCHTGKGVITLNSKLIHVPMTCVDYVVLHEFCHFIHPDHSPAFYRLVAKFMPGWKEEKKKLQSYSCRL